VHVVRIAPLLRLEARPDSRSWSQTHLPDVGDLSTGKVKGVPLVNGATCAWRQTAVGEAASWLLKYDFQLFSGRFVRFSRIAHI
jgi:hypothetical protein